MDLAPFIALLNTIQLLRKKCPWDRAQTFQTLCPHLIEEAYEVLEILEQITQVEDLKVSSLSDAFQEELGDLLLQILLYTEIARESGAFQFCDIAQKLNDKLIRRHPHLFGDQNSLGYVPENSLDNLPEKSLGNVPEKAISLEEAQSHWNAQKAKEKALKKKGELSDLPPHLPALMRAWCWIKRTHPLDMKCAFEKLEEELQKLKSEIEKPIPSLDHLELAFGELLLCICQLAYSLQIHPEQALRKTLQQCEQRSIQTQLKN